ncbi:hypothetical protein D3C71_1424230 [compost metagenome]
MCVEVGPLSAFEVHNSHAAVSVRVQWVRELRVVPAVRRIQNLTDRDRFALCRCEHEVAHENALLTRSHQHIPSLLQRYAAPHGERGRLRIGPAFTLCGALACNGFTLRPLEALHLLAGLPIAFDQTQIEQPVGVAINASSSARPVQAIE